MSIPMIEQLDVNSEFVSQVLRPYRPQCRYLKSATIAFESSDETKAPWETMVARGEFAIAESCYIDDTGHFNAVEFNICYNQLAYVMLAVCVRDRLLPALASYDLTSFYERQLSNYLIGSIESHYSSQINPRDFQGEVRITSARSRGRLSVLRTTCIYRDALGGHSEGEVKLAVLNP